MARTTDNLGLTIPDVGEPAERWTQEIADSLDRVDAHDHTTGKRITQDAIDVLGPLTLNGNPLRAASSVELPVQATAPIGAGRLYAGSDGDLYFRSGADVPVNITSGSAVAAPGGGIGGDYTASGAALTYNASTHTYFLADQAGSTANLVVASASALQLSLGDTSPSSAKTLATIGGELYYRDGSNRTYPLTNNGAATGADIRGDYHSTTASVDYNNSTKVFDFTAPASAAATVQASTIKGQSYQYKGGSRARRLFTTPCLAVGGPDNYGAFPVTSGGMAIYALPVPRGPLGSVLSQVGIEFRSGGTVSGVFIDLVWWLAVGIRKHPNLFCNKLYVSYLYHLRHAVVSCCTGDERMGDSTVTQRASEYFNL